MAALNLNETQDWISREELIRVLGELGAMRVIEVFGGVSRLFVPPPDSENYGPIAKKLGDDIARRFCSEWGNVRITLPRRLIATRDQILELKRQSLSVIEITRRLGCSRRYVYTVLSRSEE